MSMLFYVLMGYSDVSSIDSLSGDGHARWSVRMPHDMPVTDVCRYDSYWN